MACWIATRQMFLSPTLIAKLCLLVHFNITLCNINQSLSGNITFFANYIFRRHCKGYGNIELQSCLFEQSRWIWQLWLPMRFYSSSKRQNRYSHKYYHLPNICRPKFLRCLPLRLHLRKVFYPLCNLCQNFPPFQYCFVKQVNMTALITYAILLKQ